MSWWNKRRRAKKWLEQKKRIDTALLGYEQVRNLPRVDNAGQIIIDNGRRVQIMFQGVLVYGDIYYGPWMTQLIESMHGHHEPQEEFCFDAILKTLPDGATIIELGCFWAYYSTWMLKTVPNSRAILVEPDTRNLPAAVTTLALNDVTAPIELGYIGVAPESLQNQHVGRENTPVFVPRLTLDDIMTKHALDFVDIVHADIQGSEAIMLAESAELFRDGRVNYVFVSTHSEALHAECLDLVKGFGWTILAEHSLAESFSVDGLIVACSPTVTDLQQPISLIKRPK